MRGVVCVCPLVASTCQRITSFYRLTTVEVGTEPESSLYKLTSYTIGKIIFSAFQWYNLSIFISWAKKVIKQNVKLNQHFLIIHYDRFLPNISALTTNFQNLFAPLKSSFLGRSLWVNSISLLLLNIGLIIKFIPKIYLFRKKFLNFHL